MTLEQLNQLSAETAAQAFGQCCAASDWISGMVAGRPYETTDALLANADQVWSSLDETNLLEAFGAHPQIGNVNSLRKKYASTKALAAGEQSAVSQASEETLQALAQGNLDYEKKFGFIFIVCATGKSALEMLELLQARLPNTREQELLNAAREQHAITVLRLQKLLQE